MKKRPVRLILVRHGEVEANREFRYVGRRDEPLNAAGRRQAALLAGALAEVSADTLFASPMSRTRETASAIAEASQMSMRIDDRLREMDFGEWEGTSRSEIVDSGEEGRRKLEEWERDPTVATPGGESLEEVQARVVRFAEEVAADLEGGTAIVVSHMGPIKTLLCAGLGLALGSTSRLFLDPATISVVDWSSTPVVRLVNSHGHLGFGNARWMNRE